MNKVEIRKQPVELYKILKFEGLVGTGGEAKLVIEDGLVTVNGQPEMRKRRKMLAGDVFEFDGQEYQLAMETG